MKQALRSLMMAICLAGAVSLTMLPMTACDTGVEEEEGVIEETGEGIGEVGEGIGEGVGEVGEGVEEGLAE